MSWVEVQKRPSDAERQKAALTGVGDYAGEDQEYEEIRQTTMPSEEE